MGSMQGGGALVGGAWVGQDRLRPTHLRATLTRLLERERDEWEPCILPLNTHQEQHGGGGRGRAGEEVDMAGRDVAVAWLGDACWQLAWGNETKFGAAAIVDRLLLRVRIPPRYLHAVACAAVFLAAKIHEEDENVPSTEEVVERGLMDLSARELLRMERVLLDKVAWHLQATSILDFLQILHALAIVTTPKSHHPHYHHRRHHNLHLHFRGGSPSQQLEHLTGELWDVVVCGRSGSVRPSLLALSLLSLELEATSPEPGLTVWLQALTQVSDEELREAQDLVRGILRGGESCRTFLPSPNPFPLCPQHPEEGQREVPISRPNKRKVDESPASEEEMYTDIKKLYAYDKTVSTTTTFNTTSSTLTPDVSQEDADEPYTDIRRLYSSPTPLPPDPTPPPALALAPPKSPKKPTGSKKKKKKKKKTKPTFKAKSAVKSCLKQALKIPCKISLIATKQIFEEPIEEDEAGMDVEEEEEEEEEDEEEEEEGQEWEGPLVEPVGILNSPIFSPTSPEFPDIKHLVVRKEDMCWDQQAQAVAEQVYRPLTYAQVLRLHLTPLTRALGV